MLKCTIFLCFSAFAFGGVIPTEDYNIDEFIVGGNDTKISDVPYQICLLKDEYSLCGGTIVAPRFIVTAAHCVKGGSVNSFAIRAGSPYEHREGILIKAKNVHIHPKYVDVRSGYDAAVIELEKPLNYSKNIEAVPLATTELVKGDGKTSGWGSLGQGNGFPKVLQSVIVPLVDRETCKKKYQNHFDITDSMICAGVEGKDSCQGDSGGPLVAEGKLVGIVSFGVGCGEDHPGVYANVANPGIMAFIKKYVEFED